jgi:hypothetical protein
MKSYPSIDKSPRQDIHMYVFDKLDGSSIRAEWNPKKGFYKFGSRNQLIDSTHKPLGDAVDLIKAKYEEHLAMVFKEQRWREVVCFFEFLGKSSFAGYHDTTEEHTVTLFDVDVYKYGLLEPREFIKLFGHLDIPKVLYEGKVNQTLIDKVRDSSLPGITFEGVVCKGANDKKTHMPIMFKIKTKLWLDKLREHCGTNNKLFENLE